MSISLRIYGPNCITAVYLPGQCLSPTQDLMSVSLPIQGRPYLAGAGLSHWRVLVCVLYSPQRASHEDHAAQEDHPPLTKIADGQYGHVLD